MDTTTMPPLASIGIDIGKEVGFSTDGRIAFRRKIKRLALVETFKKLPPSVVGMEACLSAHFVSRALRQLGHEPRIMPAIYVKPFVKVPSTTHILCRVTSRGAAIAVTGC
jgi:transposase